MRHDGVIELGHSFLFLRDAIPTPEDAPANLDA